jgi:hypothetical protein
MDKKTLVKLLRPVFQSLQQSGLTITDVELLPISLRGYYTLAVSADWHIGMSTMDKIKFITSRIFEFVPIQNRKYIESVFPYNSPEELASDFESFYNYQSDGLCRELFLVPQMA